MRGDDSRLGHGVRGVLDRDLPWWTLAHWQLGAIQRGRWGVEYTDLAIR